MIQDYQRLGEGAQTYFGPVHRIFFAALSVNKFPQSSDDLNDLTFIIETSADPYGTGHRDTSPAWEFAGKIERLFSTDPCTQERETVRILNEKLAWSRSESSFGAIFRDTQKTVERGTNPGITMSVAALIAMEPHRQNHHTISDVFADARDHEIDTLRTSGSVLMTTNNHITVLTDPAYEQSARTPTILIYGHNLPLALQKLYHADLGLDHGCLSTLCSDLQHVLTPQAQDTDFRADIEANLRGLEECYAAAWRKIECRSAKSMDKTPQPPASA